MSDERLQRYVETGHTIEAAVPTSPNTIFHRTRNGLLEYGDVIDSGKVDHLYHSVTPEDMAVWRERLLSTPPVVITIGNLSLLNTQESNNSVSDTQEASEIPTRRE